MASYVHADQLKKNGIKVRFMIALEMIGYYNDGSFSQSYPFPLFRLTYPSKGNFIAVIGRMRDGFLVRRFKNAMRGASRVPVYSFNGPSIVPGVDLSDHFNYWKKGFKALMITDTAFYRYDHYHGAGDVPDNLDYERMAEVVTGIHGALMQLDR
jgi:Zn-dependent M28 family amino/carboxypeptidase